MFDSYMGWQKGMRLQASGLVKTGAGRLISITVSYGITSDTLNIYDAVTATGTPIFTAAFQAPAGVYQAPIYLDCDFNVGCYIEFTGGVNQIDYVNPVWR